MTARDRQSALGPPQPSRRRHASEKFLLLSGISLGCIYLYGHVATFRFDALLLGLWATWFPLAIHFSILRRAGATIRRQLALISKLEAARNEGISSRLELLQTEPLLGKVENWLPLRHRRMKRRRLAQVLPWFALTTGVAAMGWGLLYAYVPAVIAIGGLFIWLGFDTRELHSRYDQILGQWEDIVLLIPEARRLEKSAEAKTKAAWQEWKKVWPPILIWAAWMLVILAIGVILGRRMEQLR